MVFFPRQWVSLLTAKPEVVSFLGASFFPAPLIGCMGVILQQFTQSIPCQRPSILIHLMNSAGTLGNHLGIVQPTVNVDCLKESSHPVVSLLVR